MKISNILLLVTIITIITINLFSCSPANIIISGKTRPPISNESVVIYNSQSIPKKHEIIGKINVQSASTYGRSGAHKRNMKKLREKAASIGANGLLVEDIKTLHNAGGSGFINVNATVIYVDPNNETLNEENIRKEETSKPNLEKLREMKKLLDEGILTKEEFEKEKKKILNEK